MSDLTHTTAAHRSPAYPPSKRLMLAGAVLLGAAVGFAMAQAPATAQAAADAGAELTRLLRAMAVLKMALIAGAVWLVDWRLRFPLALRLAAGYVTTAGIMAAGPGLIWGMDHVVLGAVLLHGAAAVLLVLFLRDPGSPAMAWAARPTR